MIVHSPREFLVSHLKEIKICNVQGTSYLFERQKLGCVFLSSPE